MSYLNSTRLHFSGLFQAAPSTINNLDGNFQIAANGGTMGQGSFKDSQGQSSLGFNPTGNACWRFIGCRVTRAFVDGDPVGGGELFVADADARAEAKIVDLDPDQQGVSMVYGLEIRLCAPDGKTLMRGQHEPAPFYDLWVQTLKGSGARGDQRFCVAYQSILVDVRWADDLSDYPVLEALRKETHGDRLSIKYNTNGYDDSGPQSPTFTHGAVAGTIGPYLEHEPAFMTMGRHLFVNPPPPSQPGLPQPLVNYATARLDKTAGKLYVDLGNSLATDRWRQPEGLGTTFLDQGPLTVSAGGLTIGTVPYLDRDWYADTAGVAVLPSDRALTAEEIATLVGAPIGIDLPPNGAHPYRLAEPDSGEYVRADGFVVRMDADDTATVTAYATKFGEPYANATIHFDLDDFFGTMNDPNSGERSTVLDFPATGQADALGRCTLTVKSGDPVTFESGDLVERGLPLRPYIDGQVFAIRPWVDPAQSETVNPSEIISLLVHSAFKPARPITWYKDILPIFTQYRGLYPVMDTFMDLTDYDDCCTHLISLQSVFGMDINAPNYMPVTRDLSDAKRAAILVWLTLTGPDGKPVKGTPPAPSAPPMPEVVPNAEPTEPPTASAEAPSPFRPGSKSYSLRHIARLNY